MSVTWHGLDEFAADLGRFADQVEDLPEQDEAASMVAESASARAPRLTGELAGSVTTRRVGESVFVFATARYAPPIIVGVPSHRISPHPFIEAALQTREAAVMALIERGVQREADRI